MNAGVYIAIYLPIFVLLFVILPMNLRHMFVVRKLRKRRGVNIMSNELIKSCIGKTCTIQQGSMGSSYSKVKIIDVVDNWIKVQGKSTTEIVNADFIQNIKIHD